MPILPADFARIADQLQFGLSVPSTEPCSRTVAGRAYYAVYLALREAARQKLNSQSFDISHEGLQSFLDGHTDMYMQTVAEKVKALFALRVISDYWMAETLDKTTVGLHLNDANALVRDLPNVAARFNTVALGAYNQPRPKPRIK